VTAAVTQENLTKKSEVAYEHEATSLEPDHGQVPGAQQQNAETPEDCRASDSAVSESVKSAQNSVVHQEEPQILDTQKKSEKQETVHSTVGDTEYKYKVFYNETEIEATKNAQLADAFMNLHDMRQSMKQDTHNLSRINIKDFAPRLEIQEQADKRKTRRRVALEEPSISKPLMVNYQDDQNSSQKSRDFESMKHNESLD
jgi:hypothetical protein